MCKIVNTYFSPLFYHTYNPKRYIEQDDGHSFGDIPLKVSHPLVIESQFYQQFRENRYLQNSVASIKR